MAKLLSIMLVLAIVSVTVSADECEQDRIDMKRECRRYHTWPAEPKLIPSEACCAMWQRASVPCLYKDVNKDKMKVLCMEKVVFVVKYCKMSFTPGSKCGIDTIPNHA
ncbi:hypothetical protein VPH35_004776 [Triticum aestivum]